MFGHLLFFKENNIFDLIEMFKMRSANTPQLAKSCRVATSKTWIFRVDTLRDHISGPNQYFFKRPT